MGAAIQAVLGSVITIFFYAVVIAAVWKLFQMATDLTEIKTLLTDIRRNTAGPAANAVPAVAVQPLPAMGAAAAAAPPPVPTPAPPVLSGPISLESAEALLREVAEEEHALQQQTKTTA